MAQSFNRDAIVDGCAIGLPIRQVRLLQLLLPRLRR